METATATLVAAVPFSVPLAGVGFFLLGHGVSLALSWLALLAVYPARQPSGIA